MYSHLLRFFRCVDLVLYSLLGILAIWVPPLWANGNDEPVFNQLYRTGQITTFDSDGGAIDFVGSGQDGEFQRGLEWPDPRFIENQDGTLSDRLTGLMWLKDGNCFGKERWRATKTKILQLNLGEAGCHEYTAPYDDWFVPEVSELATLINAEEVSNRTYLQLNGIDNLEAGHYWSASEYLNLQNAWVVNLDTGDIEYLNKLFKAFLLPARIYDDARFQKLASLSSFRKVVALTTNDFQSDYKSRFSDNSDGTITDMRTGLMWLKDAGCFRHLDWLSVHTAVESFNEAPKDAQCRNYQAEYSDWFVPNSHELWSLIDQSFDYPALDGAFFSRLKDDYWSSTTAAASPQKAFAVNMNLGSLLALTKTSLLNVIPARFAQPTVGLPRKIKQNADGLVVDKDQIIVPSPNLLNAIDWPPSPRFVANGDGTSMDIITGINWLTDADCFGRLSWYKAIETVALFNSSPRDFNCKDYDGTFGDWLVPTYKDFNEMINPGDEDNAAWLSLQGFDNLQSTVDYWTIDETKVNLYYANVFNFKINRKRNYPKTLTFTLWPRRRLAEREEKEPILSLTVNSQAHEAHFNSGTPLSLSVYLHTFGLRYPAEFWFWYETPDGNRLWLTSARSWTESMSPIYQGKLFNLKKYEIYRVSERSSLAPGKYTFHFVIDTEPNGILDSTQYASVLTLFIDRNNK